MPSTPTGLSLPFDYTVEILPKKPPINIPASLCAGKAVLDICSHKDKTNYPPGIEGTVYSSELADCDEKTLLNELAGEDGGQLNNSGRWLIRFRYTLPETFRLKCKLQLNVRLHVRMALRC